MTAPEAYIKLDGASVTPNGEITDEGLAGVLTGFMQEFRDHVARVLTVLPCE